ncbi:MAG: hypothetical protein ABJF23_01970 [Bryobacteraceae bacterium]
MFEFFKSRIAAAARGDSIPVLGILSSEADRSMLKLAASQRIDWEPVVVGSWDAAAALLEKTRFCVIVCDRDLEGRDWRVNVRELAQLSPCILLASSGFDGALWQEVVQYGGHDVLAKPLEERRVLKTIDQALRYTATTAHASAKK